MDTFFLDTSALVKYYYPEIGSEFVETLILSEALLFISDLGILEFQSALYKKFRMKQISKTEIENIMKTFRLQLQENYYSILHLTPKVFNCAQQLLDRYGQNISLKTLDALQCSYPIFLKKMTIISSDLTLINVAKKENIKAINPEQV